MTLRISRLGGARAGSCGPRPPEPGPSPSPSPVPVPVPSPALPHAGRRGDGDRGDADRPGSGFGRRNGGAGSFARLGGPVCGVTWTRDGAAGAPPPAIRRGFSGGGGGGGGGGGPEQRSTSIARRRGRRQSASRLGAPDHGEDAAGAPAVTPATMPSCAQPVRRQNRGFDRSRSVLSTGHERADAPTGQPPFRSGAVQRRVDGRGDHGSIAPMPSISVSRPLSA